MGSKQTMNTSSLCGVGNIFVCRRSLCVSVRYVPYWVGVCMCLCVFACVCVCVCVHVCVLLASMCVVPIFKYFLTCLPSLQSDSTVTITCADGKWNKQVSCEPVDCGLPDKYHVHPAHFNFPEGTTYGKRSTFQCREPAQLVGSNNTLTCLEDGLWSFPEALCELRCPASPHVPNAMLQTKRCNDTGLKVGSLCKYKCKPGYHVTNKRAFKRQCTEDGSWLEGACEPVTCDPPPAIFHGMYQCTDGFRFDSTCWINCPRANHTVRPLHTAPCKQVCLSLLRRSTVCLCSLLCTMGLKWYPHPEVLHCIKRCDPFIGDNYCDSVNNRAFCNYDGGDCCHSTVKTKKVSSTERLDLDFTKPSQDKMASSYLPFEVV
uniref:Sushi domain-containing protein n=1 Tax=Hucho hucho TaxID=62062 RepID=A0A4W5Q0P2_9TELE